MGAEEHMSQNNQTGGSTSVDDTSTPAKLENTPGQPKSKKSDSKKWYLAMLFVILALGGVVLLLGLYYGSGFLVTRQLENRYASADCGGMLELAQTAENIYPARLVPFIAPALARIDECQVYYEAFGYYEQGDWEGAFRLFSDYLTRYPGTPLTIHAREHAAQALLNGAIELDENQEYDEAIDKLISLLEDFKDTSPAEEAKEMLPRCYLKEGKSLMGQEFYSRARASFDSAIETDPSPNEVTGPGAEARAMLPALHQAWGKSLLSRGQYQVAVEHFEQAIDLAGPDEATETKDALSAAYINWAEDEAGVDDFYAALDRISAAQASAASQTAKNRAEDAGIDVLKAFSNSGGEQAERLMKEVAESVCAGRNPGGIPNIFGVQPTRSPVSFEGLSYASDLLAETPGSTFYIACSEEEHEKIQSCPYVVSGSKTRYYIERRYTKWLIQLRDAKTAEVVAENEFKGKAPDGCPARETFRIGSFTKYNDGPPPSHTEVDEWLKSVLPEQLSPSDLELPDEVATSCNNDDGESKFLKFKSPFTTRSVTIDGLISSSDEWDNAFCVDMRFYEWGDFQDGNILRARWWVQNDDQFIYYLVSVSKDLPVRGVAADYFWPKYTGGWAHSDGVFIDKEGEFQDMSNWDESNWYKDDELSPPGSVDTEAAMNTDDEYFWFEIKKALNSGDSYDWTLEPGQIIGDNPADSFLFALVMEESFYIRYLQMELGKE
jgi:tetratricopeptide (TPR) repeat protein